MAIFHASSTNNQTPDVQVLRRSNNLWAIYLNGRPLPVMVEARWQWLARSKAKNLLDNLAEKVLQETEPVDIWAGPSIEDLTAEQIDRIWAMVRDL